MTRIERTPFEQALLDVIMEEFATIPPENEIDITVSLNFQKMCDQLLKRTRNGTAFRVGIAFRGAIIIAAIIAALITTAMAVPAMRKAITGSKREKVLDVIDSLPLSKKQKDALYISEGYAESKIQDVPWH